jgi:hypothetical protein
MEPGVCALPEVGVVVRVGGLQPDPPLAAATHRGLHRAVRPHAGDLQSERLLIESRWVSTSLAFAGKLRPRRLNNQPF